MLCVRLNGVEAYAATNDLSAAGLQAALEQAERQAERIARHALFDVRGLPPASGRSQYRSPNQDAPFPSLAECYELLAEESAKVPRDERLVNWSVFLEVSRQEQLYLNSAGAEQYHEQRFVYPGASVTAYDGHDSQTRSFGGHHAGQQGGAEVIERLGLVGAAPRIADQALQSAGGAEHPERPLRPAADAGPDDPADPRVDRPPAGAGSHPRRRAQLRRYQLHQDRGLRSLPVRLQPAQRQLRPGNPRGAGQLPPGRRRQPRAQGIPDPRRPPAASARRRPVATPQRPGGRRQQPRQQLEPRAHRPHGQSQPGARRQELRAAGGRYRARGADVLQPLLVDRRRTQQVPVRLRMGPVDRGRRTQGRGEEPQLPGHLRAVLAQPQRGGRRRHLRGARHALLRQGRAEPGDPCRPRLAGLRIQRCGRIRGDT